MTPTQIYDNEILAIITPEYYDIQAETPEERAHFLFASLKSECGHLLDRYALEFALKEYFQGLPGCINDVKFENWKILEWARSTGLLKSKSEKHEDRLLESYWHDLSAAAARLINKYKADRPTDPRLIIANSTFRDKSLKLPDVQYDRRTYEGVKKDLEAMGGKWDTKTKCFVFQYDPAPLVNSYVAGDKVNLKQEYQFFETPASLVETLIKAACLNTDHSILEPSAGQGAIIKKLNDRGLIPDVYEISPQNREILAQSELSFTLKGEDFLLAEGEQYDRIIANPPFSKNQDIAHVRKMFDLLKPGGLIVTIMSCHWPTAKEKACEDFRKFLSNKKHTFYDIEAGTFKSSGTNVAAKLLILSKDKDKETEH